MICGGHGSQLQFVLKVHPNLSFVIPDVLPELRTTTKEGVSHERVLSSIYAKFCHCVEYGFYDSLCAVYSGLRRYGPSKMDAPDVREGSLPA